MASSIFAIASTAFSRGSTLIWSIPSEAVLTSDRSTSNVSPAFAPTCKITLGLTSSHYKVMFSPVFSLILCFLTL
ncbi:hypothetical protein, partial [Brevibacillus agri]|uniref:hypothetical protein n=1 Tax=Brevibacillus agri TaxID=51101 RepID=UPI002E1BCB57|nr:hypothetical protein [Brevibacillus agri]